MSVKWIPFDPKRGELPQRKDKLYLVQIAGRKESCGNAVEIMKLTGMTLEVTLPAAVAVGYMKRYSDGSPYWVIPGVGGTVTHYADCLPEDLNPPEWPGFWKKTSEPGKRSEAKS